MDFPLSFLLMQILAMLELISVVIFAFLFFAQSSLFDD